MSTATVRSPGDETLRARAYLEQTRDRLLDATGALSPAQWGFKPAPDRWSILEIVEHLAITQELVLGPVRQSLVAAPHPGTGDRDEIDTLLVERFPDRTEKFTGPPVLFPTGKVTPEQAVERFAGNCGLLIEYLESTPDLRSHAVPAAPLKALTRGKYELMDGYQWILTSAAHVDRHIRQIAEVKADAGYPAP